MSMMATATLESISPLSQSRYHDTAKKDRENPKDYEARTWRNRLHTNDKDEVFIPPMAFKNCLSEAAKFLSVKVPGKARATYTKHFVAGVLCVDPVPLGIKGEEVEGEWLFVPSDGVRGGGKRVDKRFPVIPEWSCTVTFYILDSTITKKVFEQHLTEAGNFIGIGRFRPINNGFYGRFKVKNVAWSE